MERLPGPAALWLVRHAESMGNVADARAHSTGAGRLHLDVRDPDVPLSELGRRQAASVGRWIGEMDPRQQPTAVLVSTYVRALQTADIALKAAGLEHLPRVRDERLREREFGVLDELTSRGIRERFPARSRRRRA